MAIGLMGRKLGMTQWISNDGRFIPVSCLETGPCVVLNIKDNAITLGFEDINEKKLRKSQRGFFKKLKLSPKKVIRDFPKDAQEYKIGQEIRADIFKENDFIDIKGVSIGKGFQGGMKRWNWRGGPRSHGSMSHRRVGSISSSAFPSRVFRGRTLPGHMGARIFTIQNLKIVKVDTDNNLMLVKGAVPGYKNSLLIIRKSKKKTKAEEVIENKDKK